MAPAKLEAHDALLLVDLQKDFFPGGALAVSDAGGVLEECNAWIDAAQKAGCVIVASRDWHPPDHMSFRAQGGPWPEHCVRETEGAAFCDELRLPERAIIVNKAEDPGREQYSDFEGSGLAERLLQQGVRRLWVTGVAQEYCVKATVFDALRAGFEVHVVVKATAPVDEQDGRAALEAMQAAGAVLEGGG